MTAFEEMGVLPEISMAVDEMKWNLPTDVQAEAIPLILGGGDVLMAAETGTGKTGAFCLPVLQIVWESLSDQVKKGSSPDVNEGSSEQNEYEKWKLNSFDRGSALAVGPNGKTCQSRNKNEWHGCRAMKGVHKKGLYYYEAKLTDEGMCRFGWSTLSAVLNLGSDKQGFGYGVTGRKSFGKQFDFYGEPFGKNDVVGCYLNLDKHTIKFSKNGKDLGEAYKIPGQLWTSAFFPAVVLKNAEVEINFGETPFKFPPKDGFIAICLAFPHCIVESTITGVGVVKDIAASPQAIILEPTRELAEQTLKCIQNFKKHLKDPCIQELLIVGGTPAKQQNKVLKTGVNIVVATPGRLDILISTGQLSLAQVRFFILDEADGLLSQGYTDLINRIHKLIPKNNADGKRLQMIICSATLHSAEVKLLAERLMRFPTWVDLKGENCVPETVHHVVCTVDPMKDSSWKNLKTPIQTDKVHDKDTTSFKSNTPEMLSKAVKLLKGKYVVNAIDEHKMEKCIIFCRTKLDCDNMEKHLKTLSGGSVFREDIPYSCVCLHGDLTSEERKEHLDKFKTGEAKFLICTDVAARGIDVTGVPYVINVTLPDEKDNYMHRIGRVGRAERMGLSISLVSAVPEKVWFHKCPSKGKSCWNTNLTREKGCCIWYNESQKLDDIEKHLKCTIEQIDTDIKVPYNEFDGKVVYGQKRQSIKSNCQTHIAKVAPNYKILTELENKTQTFYIKKYCTKDEDMFFAAEPLPKRPRRTL